jgi:hypothetical protein
MKEIRSLYELDVDNVAVRGQLAMGLGNVWIKTNEKEKKNVLEELRAFRDRWPDDDVWKLEGWNPIFKE